MPEGKPTVYLACPYTHPEINIMELRYRAVTRIASTMLLSGKYFVFSPITHHHPMSIEACIVGKGIEGAGGSLMLEQDTLFLSSICTELWIVQLHGWKESGGVKHEIKQAKKLGLPIYTVNPLSFSIDPHLTFGLSYPNKEVNPEMPSGFLNPYPYKQEEKNHASPSL
jgi:hypothetical protein